MWGVGDAAAALIGIPFGRHKVMIKPVNGKKSWEGSIAMFIVSSICGLFVFYFCQKVSFPVSVVLCLTGALAGTVTELFSPGEWDTVTVPVYYCSCVAVYPVFQNIKALQHQMR